MTAHGGLLPGVTRGTDIGRRRLTASGDAAAGILLGRDHLDRLQLDLIGQIAEWLRLIAGMGQGDVSVQGLW